MEDNFKIPSLDNKIKFVPRKPPNQEVSDVTENSNKNDNLQKDTHPARPDSELMDTQPPPTPINAIPKPSTTESQKSKPKPTIQIKCSYMEPKWSKKPADNLVYSFEVLKNGQIVENIKNLQEKPFWLIGKLPENHIPMAHPTISRFHAVFQYRPEVLLTKPADEMDKESNADESGATKPKSSDIEKGWYLYDLGSTHGSFVNKMKIPPKTYVRVRVGYMIRFGGSTRTFILQGPALDEDAESELTITEMKELNHRKKLEAIEKQQFQEQQREAEGINWGMSEDADEETDLSLNPFAATNNEELFLDDPKKTLRGYFEREGFDLDYRVDEMSPGTFVCRIELPITDSNGRPITAELCHKGKKKDCVLQAALEACRILDRHGVLRQAHHEPRKRKIENSDSDDDDDFYDRTGAVERRRQQKAAATAQTNALSYAELLAQERQLIENIEKLNSQIDDYQNRERLAKKSTTNTVDDLDDFMINLSKDDKQLDKIEIRRMRIELQTLKTDHLRLQKLINIARPIDLPPLKLNNDDPDDAMKLHEKPKPKLNLPLFGKRGGAFKFGGTLSTVVAAKKSDPVETIVQAATTSKENDYKSDEEEIEEQHNEELPTTSVDEQTESKPDDVSKHLPQSTSPPPSPSKVRSSSQKTDKPNPETTENEIDLKEMAAAKKRRNRVRIRGDRYRENVDIDDSIEHKDVAKYSTWVPPDNQSGDGSTNLNQKYGY